MKSTVTSLITLFLISIISLILKNITVFIIASFVFGFGSIIISGLISGALGDHQFAFQSLESKKERSARINLQLMTFTFGLPLMLAFAISAYLHYKHYI